MDWLPVGGERGEIKLRDAVVEGDKHCDGEDDDESPQTCGEDERRERGSVATENGFCDEENEAEAVPERHHEAEERGEEAEGFGLRLGGEFVEGGVDEGRDGELDADQEAEGQDGEDVEKAHAVGSRV